MNIEYRDNNDDGTNDLLKKIGNEISDDENNKHLINNDNQNKNDVPIIFDYLPSLIHELYKNNINFYIESSGEVIIKDFYRPNSMKMIMNKDETFFIENRKEVIPINNVDDLILFNYREWKKTGKGKGNYDTPSRVWSELFNEKGLIKRQVTFIPNDD